MERDDIIKWFEENRKKGQPIRIPEEIYKNLTVETAYELVRLFGHNTLCYLPNSEVQFFEWLRVNDYSIWEDLWGGVDEDPYVVSLAFIPLLFQKTRGFPICDLANNDNYYFTEDLIVKKSANLLLETLREKFLKKEPLTIAQILLLEISVAPLDIWHFAYHHRVSIQKAKEAVKELVDDNLIIHLKKAEEIAEYVKF
ncbi:MAG: hypothetical protein N2517_07440 [Ignavibacteria bacterium]|nr:hypothetical protein [Ignavibacteria bacterium]